MIVPATQATRPGGPGPGTGRGIHCHSVPHRALRLSPTSDSGGVTARRRRAGQRGDLDSAPGRWLPARAESVGLFKSLPVANMPPLRLELEVTELTVSASDHDHHDVYPEHWSLR
jgi:hypothetical protein